MTELSIHPRTTNRVLTLTVSGEVDMDNHDALAAATRTAVSTGLDAIIVDLRRVSFIDSSGIRTLLLSQEHARSHGVAYQVVNPSPTVRRVLEISGLLAMLTGVRPPVEPV